MPQQTINIGAAANDGTGDTLRDAFDKCNDNFDEIYAGGIGGGGGGGGIQSRALYQDRKPANTAGGTSVSGSWQTRTLNTEVFDDIGGSLATNQITLQAGTYDVSAMATFYRATTAKLRVRDVTNNVTLAVSLSHFLFNNTTDGDQSIHLSGRFTLTAEAVIELQYRVGNAQTGSGLGNLTNFGEEEVYASLLLAEVGSSGGGGSSGTQEVGSLAAGIDSRTAFAAEFGPDEGYDEEFDGAQIAEDTLPAGWIWANKGAAVYRQAFGHGRVDWGGGSSDIYDLHAVMFPLVADSWELYAHMFGQIDNSGDPSYSHNLILHNDVSGEFISMGLYRANDTGQPQTFLSYYANANPSVATTVASGSKVTPPDPRMYFHIVKNSNTDYDFYWSFDGGCWFALIEGINLTGSFQLNGGNGAPTHIGFACNSPEPAHTGLEWIRLRNVVNPS